MLRRKKQKYNCSEHFRKIVFPEQNEYFDERKKHQTITVKGVFAKEGMTCQNMKC